MCFLYIYNSVSHIYLNTHSPIFSLQTNSDISIPKEPSLNYIRPYPKERERVDELIKAGKMCLKSSCLNLYTKRCLREIYSLSNNIFV